MAMVATASNATDILPIKRIFAAILAWLIRRPGKAARPARSIGSPRQKKPQA
jgi:hypothetical protein